MAYLSNIAVVRKMLDVIEQGIVANIENVFAPNWVNHDPSLPPMQGLEGAKTLVGLWSGGLSKTKVTIEDSVTEGDRVAVRFRIMGTNSGEMMGIPATGRLINVVGTGIFWVVDGKVTDNWVNFDALGLMQQLGVVPLTSMPGV
jgi:limonene-1,2-epoxide hydrolase